MPLSLRYYFLTIVFLVFDLEIVYLLFLPTSLDSVSSGFPVLCGVVFVGVLYLGLLYEWSDGSLE